MPFIYDRANGIATEARRLYDEVYPHRQLPSHRTFGRIHQRLRDIGSLSNQFYLCIPRAFEIILTLVEQ